MTLQGGDSSNGQMPDLAGASFWFHRATYGSVEPDSGYAAAQARYAAAGLIRGSYLFLRPSHNEQGVPLDPTAAQANVYCSIAPKAQLPAVDWEEDTFPGGTNGVAPLAEVDQALDICLAKGQNAGVYAQLSRMDEPTVQHFVARKVPFLWVAAWGLVLPDYILNCGVPIFQQYQGGLQSDLDWFFGTQAQLNALVGITQGVDSMLNMSGYPQRVTVNKGDPFYAKAGDTAPVGHYAATGAITVIGRVLNPGGWYCAQTTTGAGYPDGIRRPSGVYLHLDEPVSWLPTAVLDEALPVAPTDV